MPYQLAFGDLAREFPQGIFPLAAGVRIRARAVAQYNTFAGLFLSGCGIISLQSLSPASLVESPLGQEHSPCEKTKVGHWYTAFVDYQHSSRGGAGKVKALLKTHNCGCLPACFPLECYLYQELN